MTRPAAAPPPLAWSVASNQVRHSRVRPWPTLSPLLRLGGSPASVVDRFIAAVAAHTPEAREPLLEAFIVAVAADLQQALTDLATAAGTPWHEVRNPADTTVLVYGPEVRNVAVSTGWSFTDPKGKVSRQETACHPVVGLSHIAGSGAPGVYLEAKTAILFTDPPISQPNMGTVDCGNNQGTDDAEPPEHQVARPQLLKARLFASAGGLEPAVVRLKHLLACNSTIDGPSCVPKQGVQPVQGGCPDDCMAPSLIAARAPGWLDLGRLADELLWFVQTLVGDPYATSPNLSGLTAAADRLLALACRDLPKAIDSVSAPTLGHTLETITSGGGQNPAPTGWLVTIEGLHRLPTVDNVAGVVRFYVSAASVARMRDSLMVLLGIAPASVGTGLPEPEPAHAPFAAPRTDPADTVFPKQDYPDVGEPIAFTLLELARASLQGTPAPFATADRRTRLGRLAQHMVHVALPRGTRVFFPASNGKPVLGKEGTLRVTLDGWFADAIAPRLEATLDLPRSGGSNPIAHARAAAHVHVAYADIAEALARFVAVQAKLRDALGPCCEQTSDQSDQSCEPDGSTPEHE